MKRLVRGNMMRWLPFPPIFSFVLLLLAALLHNRDAALKVPPIVWGLTIAAYICLCAISLYYISRREKRYALGVTLLTQGLLLSVMSMQFGTVFLSWIGLVMFLVGLCVVFFYATQGSTALYDVPAKPKAENEETEQARMENLVSKLDVPICIVDSKGTILGANQAFYEAVEREPGDIEGEIVNEVIPIDQEEFTLGSGTWWVSQAKEGNRYYISLLPTPQGKPVKEQPKAPRAVVETAEGGIPGLFDSDTGLYTEEYRKIRGPEEISRANRYKRSLAGILLELTFDGAADVSLSKEQEEMLFHAYASKVKAALRITDCGFRLKERRIHILLPETPLAGAATLAGRLAALPREVFDDDIRNAVRPKVFTGQFFYNGTTKMEYGIFSATLEEAFNKNKAESASKAA